MEFREGDILEGSAHAPMNNPHIFPLNKKKFKPTTILKKGSILTKTKNILNKRIILTTGTFLKKISFKNKKIWLDTDLSCCDDRTRIDPEQFSINIDELTGPATSLQFLDT